MSELTTAIPQLAQLPQCILPAFEALAAAGCGPNLSCICANGKFFVTLQGVAFQGSCTPPEVQEGFTSTRRICAKEVPWLNDSRGPELVTAATIMTFLAILAVILRCIARRIKKLAFGIDDWLIIVALVWSCGLTAVLSIAVHLGSGRHILMVGLENLMPIGKASFPLTSNRFPQCFFAVDMTFGPAIYALKFSILFFYQRIFVSRRFRIISIVIGVFSLAAFLAFVLVSLFANTPLAYFWDKSIPGGRENINGNNRSYYVTGWPDVLTNLALLFLPLPYLWRLQMDKSRKLALTAIFLLGSFAVIGSIVRIPLIALLDFNDPTYTSVNPGIWISVECNIGILSACLPTFGPLFKASFPSMIRSKLSRSRQTDRSRSITLASKDNHNPQPSAGIYQGGPKAHTTWYSGVNVNGKKGDGAASDGSQEEMVPMGKIAVRHDVNWDASDKEPHSIV